MRAVFAIAALMAAAIILTPALGYTIQASGSPYPFTFALGDRANYTIQSGEPAHEMALEQAIASAPRYSFSSQRVPYSFNTAGVMTYTAETGAVTNGISTLGAGTQDRALTLGMGAETKGPGRLGAYPAATPAVAAAPTAVPETVAVAEPVEAAVPVENITPDEIAPAAAPAITAAPAAVPETAAVAEPVGATVPAENITPDEIAPAAPATYTISGTVFNDVNYNGAMDAGETGIAGWIVNLAQAGTTLTNATTDDSGAYAFPGLAAGEYAVSQTIQDGWTAISPAEGSYTVNVVDMDIPGLDFANSMIPAENATVNATVPA